MAINSNFSYLTTKSVIWYTICGIDAMAETLILSFYPTNRSLYKGLRRCSEVFFHIYLQLFWKKFASHKKVL
jgi:hypothetical protein